MITNLIIFPPSFLLLQIFRKSRPRDKDIKSTKLKKVIETQIQNSHGVSEQNEPPESTEKPKKIKKKQNRFMLPWWFKIIGYVLAACIVAVSIFFIIVKGISFGDSLCRQWLTSFLISVVTSVLLTQPIQVALLSIFFILLFRKANDEQDNEYDHLDNGESLNKLKFQKTSPKTVKNLKFVSFSDFLYFYKSRSQIHL